MKYLANRYVVFSSQFDSSRSLIINVVLERWRHLTSRGQSTFRSFSSFENCFRVLFVVLGPGKRGHIVADTLLPTQMFPRLPSRAIFVADTKFVSGRQKRFLILFRNILYLQQTFPSLRSPRNMANNVSATLCPRLPGPLALKLDKLYSSIQEEVSRFKSLCEACCAKTDC